MWLLILIMLFPSITSETVLKRYLTERECAVEQARVLRDMEEAYPHERNFRLICRYVWRMI